MSDNPFPITGYEKPEYFCDREKEARRLVSAIANKRNTTLFSDRKVGKTGLIQHVFYQYSKKRNTATIYFDILGTTNLQEFVKAFAGAVIGKLDSKAIKFLQSASGLVKSLRPKISYDTLTGEPEISIDINTPKEASHTLDEIFNYLKVRSRETKIIIAIDEFQQVLDYPEKGTEAVLRSKIQFLNNVSFIFSGSRKHLLMEMFTDARRPFYHSTDMMLLEKINPEIYTEFISRHFKKAGKNIFADDVRYILEWTRGITFYVQSVCNRLFYSSDKKITRENINETFLSILSERESGFFNYRSMLGLQQWNLLEAVAKNDGVKEPSGAEFIHRHQLGANSSVRTALKALLEKELIVKEDEKFHVYDVFFSRWLERL